MALKNHESREVRSPLVCLRKREHSIGVSVNATSSDTMIENAIVRPKVLRKRPVTLWMNATGTKMTTSESVVALTARPTSAVAAFAAAIGDMPFSSMKRKMFSSTTIASSMTMPTASVSASSDSVLSVKPIHKSSV